MGSIEHRRKCLGRFLENCLLLCVVAFSQKVRGSHQLLKKMSFYNLFGVKIVLSVTICEYFFSGFITKKKKKKKKLRFRTKFFYVQISLLNLMQAVIASYVKWRYSLVTGDRQRYKIVTLWGISWSLRRPMVFKMFEFIPDIFSWYYNVIASVPPNH